MNIPAPDALNRLQRIIKMIEFIGNLIFAVMCIFYAACIFVALSTIPAFIFWIDDMYFFQCAFRLGVVSGLLFFCWLYVEAYGEEEKDHDTE